MKIWIYWSESNSLIYFYIYIFVYLRDRPFNIQGGVMVFCFVQNFFFGQHKSYIIFFVMQSAHFFLQNVTLGYMTKTLNQIIIFFLHQNQNIFFSNIGNQNILLEKNHTPHWKLNGPSLNKNWKIYWPKQILLVLGQRTGAHRDDCQEVQIRQVWL